MKKDNAPPTPSLRYWSPPPPPHADVIVQSVILYAARRSALRQSHISRIEGGDVDLRFSVFKKLLNALGCAPALLAKTGTDFDRLHAEQDDAAEEEA